MKITLILTLLILFPFYCFAETENLPELNYLPDFVNMLISLFFVILLIIGTLWFLKKFTRSRMKHSNQNMGIKILERRVLNQKASLYLVDILGKGVVISESQQGVHLIAEFPEGTNVEALLDSQMPEEKPSVSFSEILNKIKNRAKNSA